MYDSVTIAAMNNTETWNRTIEHAPGHLKKDELYRLHATGACTLSGRVYVALPVHVDASRHDTKKQYNLL